MNGFLFAALLIPALASAEPCTPRSSGPCVPDDIAERRKSIMLAITAGLKAHDEMDESSTRSSYAGDDELKLEYWTDEREYKKEMTDDFNRAIRLTQEAYHLTPPRSADPRAQMPSDPQGAWSANIKAPWTPRFAISDYRAIVGSDGNTHYVSDNPQETSGNNVAAVTDPDGTVTIFPYVIDRALSAGDPGILASALHHESQHYRDLITTGWDTHERGEIRAFTASLAMLTTFIPSETDREVLADFFKRQLESYQEAVDDKKEHSPFSTEAQERYYKEKFVAQIARENEY